MLFCPFLCFLEARSFEDLPLSDNDSTINPTKVYPLDLLNCQHKLCSRCYPGLLALLDYSPVFRKQTNLVIPVQITTGPWDAEIEDHTADRQLWRHVLLLCCACVSRQSDGGRLHLNYHHQLFVFVALCWPKLRNNGGFREQMVRGDNRGKKTSH